MREINIVFAPDRNIWQMIEPAARNQPFSSDSFSEAVFLRDILHALDTYISDTNPVRHKVGADEHLIVIALAAYKLSTMERLIYIIKIVMMTVEHFFANRFITLRHGYDLAKFICGVIQ